MLSDVLCCFPMFSAFFRCSQLGCNFQIITPFAMHNHPLRGHFVELSLCSRESNWTKFDRHWETISGSFSIPFGSKLEVQSQCARIIVLYEISFIQVWYFYHRDLGIDLLWDNHPPHQPSKILSRVLKSSSSWTKLTVMASYHLEYWGSLGKR